MAISSEAGYDATAGLPRSVGVVEPVPLIRVALPLSLAIHIERREFQVPLGCYRDRTERCLFHVKQHAKSSLRLYALDA